MSKNEDTLVYSVRAGPVKSQREWECLAPLHSTPSLHPSLFSIQPQLRDESEGKGEIERPRDCDFISALERNSVCPARMCARHLPSLCNTSCLPCGYALLRWFRAFPVGYSRLPERRLGRCAVFPRESTKLQINMNQCRVR